MQNSIYMYGEFVKKKKKFLKLMCLEKKKSPLRDLINMVVIQKKLSKKLVVIDYNLRLINLFVLTYLSNLSLATTLGPSKHGHYSEADVRQRYIEKGGE